MQVQADTTIHAFNSKGKPRSVNTFMDNADSQAENDFRYAKAVNNIGLVVFFLSLIIFNVIYWLTAMFEYFAPLPAYGICTHGDH